MLTKTRTRPWVGFLAEGSLTSPRSLRCLRAAPFRVGPKHEPLNPDRTEHEKSPPRIRPKRSIRPPNSYAREQEEESEANNARTQRKSNPRVRQRSQSDAPTGREAPAPEDTTPTDNEDLEPVKLLTELTRLREEIKKRDEAHQKELQIIKAEFRAALAEVQRDLKDLKNTTASPPQRGSEPCSQTSHEDILQELQSLRSAITTPKTTSDGRSWARVTAGGDQAQPATVYSLLNNGNQNKEYNCIRVNTKPNGKDGEDEGENTFRRYLPPRAAVAHIQNALATTNETKDIQVLGVGTTRTGSTTICGRAHRTPTEDFLSPESERTFIEKIVEENNIARRGHRISQVAWLKPRDKPIGKHGSLAIWFDTREAAEWTMDNGLLIGQRYIGSLMPYRLKERRCYDARHSATSPGLARRRRDAGTARPSTSYDTALPE
ncbi:hypothetical protein CNMCM6805_003707 [Aspergillus fumigatiaffinis]|uniref:Uncharacterized protein n=1 Tax=Aspergillus fumigatiaffinis TaxID=340414 RepID=A0A8H4GRR8_9EURO|nr:hypothetical protein CNMCM6457_008656 [Aspergillus fumigatiaffinis]KAF4227014.1 hypothetical protein CNMCM6805_003707 [Aspergillus fumigatiaffinis]